MRQYAASPVIQRIVADRKSYFPSAWQDEFYDNYWNIDTAQGYGLDVWGRIVVIGRNVTVEITEKTFGYNEAWSGGGDPQPVPGPITVANIAIVAIQSQSGGGNDDRITPFNEAPFYDGLQATETVSLSDNAYRSLILAKALANISNCTTRSLNKILNALFGGPDRRCYVQTSNSMDIRYVFEFELTPVERTIAVYSGVVPRAAGVKLAIMQVDPGSTFGFAESQMQPFDQGVFFGDEGIINAK